MLVLILWVFHIKNSEFIRILDLLLIITCCLLIAMCIYVSNIIYCLLIFWIEISSKPSHTRPVATPRYQDTQKREATGGVGKPKNRSNRDRYFPMALKISPSRKKMTLFFIPYIWIHWFNFDGLNLICFRDSWRKEFFMTLSLHSKLSKAKIGK